MEGKRFFDSIKPYRKTKNRQLFLKLLRPLVGMFIPKDKVVFTEEIPKDEAVIFVCNHSKRYAPLSLYFNMPRKMRIWSLSSLFFTKTFSNHMMYDIFPNARGIRRIFLRVVTNIAALIGPLVFRAIECIPVYRQSLKIKDTYDKSIETLKSQIDVLIFPESRENDPNFTYINKLQTGFYRFAPTFYAETGKKVRLYPIYCCQELKTIVVGKGYIYNPDINIKSQVELVCNYIQNSIEEMALSLPPHSPVPYGESFKDIEYDKKKYKGIY